MRYALPALLFVLAAAACAPLPRPEPYTQSYDMWLGRSVDAGDGIDKDEASIIAYAFYASGASDCGSPLEPRLTDDDWISNTLTDSGKPGDPIYIDAKTGEVSCGDAVLSLDELRRFERKTD
ncbi:MAG TPA: hypothetical protein VFX02_04765 [Gammaproteobacteria bacterium]|nr:hypothetical protein [Gammaproteobacteria bacterium]